MKATGYFLLFLLACTACARQPSLPANSPFNVTSTLNDSTWYGTGKVLRLRKAAQQPEQIKRFNLLVFTDIDYPGVSDGPNPKTHNGCRDPECTRTQSLLISNIPLKKGLTQIATLNKRSQVKNEYASFSYIGNAGGTMGRYIYQGEKPGWIRITKFDKASGIVEGRFEVSFSKDTLQEYPLQNNIPPTARFTSGLFRIKLTDVLVR